MTPPWGCHAENALSTWRSACALNGRERRLEGACGDIGLGCMNVFTSVMSIINSIYLWCVFSLFFCHQKQGHREEREIKRVRKRERKKKEGGAALGI